MDLKTFKIEFDEILRPHLENKIQSAKNLLEHNRLNNFLQHTLNYIFWWWKRIRPYLAYLWYNSMGWKNKKEIMQFIMVFEIFHNMALIHDDIIDKSKLRHNVNCIHEFINKEIKDLHIAEGQAMLIWDLLLSRMHELLNENYNFNIEDLQKAKKNIHKMIHEVILGEMIDVDMMLWEDVNDKDLEKKNIYKTAKYTFTRPLMVWAIIAWAQKEEIEKIWNMWTQLGLAYQTRDDLMDLIQHDTSKSTFGDVQEWAQTSFTNYVYKNGSEKQKKLLKSCMRKQLSPNQISSLKTMFHESGAINYWKKLIQKYGQEATQILDSINFTNTKYKQHLHILIQKITNIDI